MLDINFGVHTILNLICLILLVVSINKIDLFTAVKGSMFATLAMVFVEAINVGVLQLIFGASLKTIIENPYQKALAGIPGITMYGIIVISTYFYLIRKKAVRGDNGTVGE
jgi:hypothetical protein